MERLQQLDGRRAEHGGRFGGDQRSDDVTGEDHVGRAGDARLAPVGRFCHSSAGYNLSGGGTNTLTLSSSASGATITVTNGSHQINAPVVLGGNLLVAGSGTGTWTLGFGSAAGITDNSSGFSLTMNGSGGTLVLSGSNTYGGGTTISAGMLQLGSGGTSGSVSGPIVIDAGGTLVLDRSNNMTLGNAISGGGTLTKTGGDTLTLSNAGAFPAQSTLSRASSSCRRPTRPRPA